MPQLQKLAKDVYAKIQGGLSFAQQQLGSLKIQLLKRKVD